MCDTHYQRTVILDDGYHNDDQSKPLIRKYSFDNSIVLTVSAQYIKLCFSNCVAHCYNLHIF